MSKNPFKTSPKVDDVKKNAFDLSESNNLTLKVGQLTPVYCREVLPKDTFDIDADFGLRFMPLNFPVQSRMRADIHFFYVRNRNLWKNWKNFITNTKDCVMPYIGDKTQDSNFYAEGSLADYLGVPVTTTSSVSNNYTVGISDYTWTYTEEVAVGTGGAYDAPIYSTQEYQNSYFHIIVTPTELGEPLRFTRGNRSLFVIAGETLDAPLKVGNITINLGRLPDFAFPTGNQSITITPMLLKLEDSKYVPVAQGVSTNVTATSSANYSNGVITLKYNLTEANNKKWFTTQGMKSGEEFFNLVGEDKLILSFNLTGSSAFYTALWSYLNESSIEVLNKRSGLMDLSVTSFNYTTEGYNRVYNGAYNTYNNDGCRLNALPFRAYENIFNSFYRNEVIAPLLGEDGEPIYDIFNTSQDDGADNYDYKLYNRYWEKDFLTTSVPSPQQGFAPLVGVTTNTPLNTQRLVLTNPDTGAETVYDIKYDESGQVKGIDGMSESLPVGTLEALESAIDYGISINDFRNVNALQRWLENNVKHGYLYRDQLLAHFGVDLDFAEMNMAEFIGGFSQDVNVNALYNQAATDQAKLGEFVGTAGVYGKGDNHVHHFCPEHGFIIGILSISPIPTYNQILPKHFTKSHHLDYYSPEFGHLGYQPIPAKEVSPLTSVTLGTGEETFGYQRAWYDYVSSYDSTHSAMSSSLRNYTIGREFPVTPYLDENFISIDNEEINDIFSVTKDTDKILGQVNFKVTASRAIPFFGTPSL